jgi:predicted peptidase
MKIKLALVIILTFFCFSAKSQDKSLFKKEIYVSGTDTLQYRFLLPLNYDASKKYPLILFLHGSGERGNDNEAQLIHGSSLFLRDSIREKYPAIVIFPQCRENSYWSNVNRFEDKHGEERYIYQAGGKPTLDMELLQRLLKKIIKEYPVEKKQIYAGGLSMGGMGTFEVVWRNPKLFAAAFPICGGADVASAKRFKKTHWWIFHGAKDDVVMPQFSQRIVTALEEIQADVKFTLYPEANHNSWDNAFAEPDLLPWLFSQKKK